MSTSMIVLGAAVVLTVYGVKLYNASARELNNAMQVFPKSLLARAFNFKSAEFFDTDAGEKEVVKVSF